jgi:hypothetical protein
LTNHLADGASRGLSSSEMLLLAARHNHQLNVSPTPASLPECFSRRVNNIPI